MPGRRKVEGLARSQIRPGMGEKGPRIFFLIRVHTPIERLSVTSTTWASDEPANLKRPMR